MSALPKLGVKLGGRSGAANGLSRAGGGAGALVSALNLHWAGVGVLALVNVYLLVNMAIAFQQMKSHDAEALARQQVALKTAQIGAKPLQGLDVKLAAANANADEFSEARLPTTYSEVASELGSLAKRQKVRLTRVQYAQQAVAGDMAGALREVRMDASLSGDYRPLVLFLNGLERDKVFFLITGVTLTGQQTGTVNLRIRLTTFLRGVGIEEDRQSVTRNETDRTGETNGAEVTNGAKEERTKEAPAERAGLLASLGSARSAAGAGR